MERPILFSTKMVQAILKLIKHMTRRTRGLEKINENPGTWEINGTWYDFEGKFAVEFRHKQTGEFVLVKCPYGKVGDMLWVRETWCDWPDDCGHNYFYKATDDGVDGFSPKWKPSIHMPKSACRIRLKIKDIRVERLQDITEEDAKAEGIKEFSLVASNGTTMLYGTDLHQVEHGTTAKVGFEILWDSINKNRGYGWDVNPYVWVIEFERVECEGNG